MISKKVILTGSFGVGKTSLFNKLLYSKFSEKYLTTIGVKVDKKVMTIGDKELSMLLWDIAGEVSQDKVPNSYFLGASGIVYVLDVTRPITYQNISKDINYLKNLLPGVSLKVVGNKKDLISEEEIQQVKENCPVAIDVFTSAKTGEQVEEMFESLGKKLLGSIETNS